MNNFTIKDLENLSGIKAHTLRIWEQRYGFIKPNRTFTNIRLYSNEELKTILNISLLNRYGFKISHIDRMSHDEISQKILTLNQPDAQHERIINELIRYMIDLDMAAFENTLDDYIVARGIERGITQVIFPFLGKIGILWQTNHINPAQEHLVSNMIRQKLIVGIQGARPVSRIPQTGLLFLPEGEHHELGLLFMHYLLRSRGAEIIYLGANIPMQDIEYVVKLKKPDFLYTHLTTVAMNFNFERFIGKMSKSFPYTPVIMSGMLTNTYEKKIHPPVIFKRSYTEVMEFINSLG